MRGVEGQGGEGGASPSFCPGMGGLPAARVVLTGGGSPCIARHGAGGWVPHPSPPPCHPPTPLTPHAPACPALLPGAGMAGAADAHARGAAGRGRLGPVGAPVDAAVAGAPGAGRARVCLFAPAPPCHTQPHTRAYTQHTHGCRSTLPYRSGAGPLPVLGQPVVQPVLPPGQARRARWVVPPWYRYGYQRTAMLRTPSLPRAGSPRPPAPGAEPGVQGCPRRLGAARPRGGAEPATLETQTHAPTHTYTASCTPPHTFTLPPHHPTTPPHPHAVNIPTHPPPHPPRFHRPGGLALPAAPPLHPLHVGF